MPATVKLIERYQMGNGKANIVDITPGVYAAGGVDVNPSHFGVTIIHAVFPGPMSGYTFQYEFGKLKAYKADAEVVNGVNLNFPVRCVVIGK